MLRTAGAFLLLTLTLSTSTGPPLEDANKSLLDPIGYGDSFFNDKSYRRLLKPPDEHELMNIENGIVEKEGNLAAVAIYNSLSATSTRSGTRSAQATKTSNPTRTSTLSSRASLTTSSTSRDTQTSSGTRVS